MRRFRRLQGGQLIVADREKTCYIPCKSDFIGRGSHIGLRRQKGGVTTVLCIQSFRFCSLSLNCCLLLLQCKRFPNSFQSFEERIESLADGSRLDATLLFTFSRD